MNGGNSLYVVRSQDTAPLKSVHLRAPGRIARNFREIFCAALLGMSLIAANVVRADGAKKPDFNQVAAAVASYFVSLPNYQPGDLISQKHVKGALAAAAAIGWEVPNGDKVAAQALADNSFVVRELSKPEGRKFMRKLAKTPGAFSRLDRLSTIPNGQKLIRDLIRQKGGDQLIDYLATTAGGRSLGRMMGGLNENGVDLNTPTNRVYTADQLLAVLSSIYNTPTP